MANLILPGDIIFSPSVAPGLSYVQPNDKSSGFPIFDQSVTLDAVKNAVDIDISANGNQIATIANSVLTISNTNGESAPVNPAAALAGTAYAVAWSPLGDRIAVAHATSPYITQYRYPALTKLVDVDVLPVATGSCVAYSPSGGLLACGFRATSYTAPGFRLYSIGTSDVKISDPPDGLLSNAVGLDFSPDGSMLCAVGYATTATHCRIYNTSDWSSFTLTKVTTASFNQGCKFSPDGSKLAIFGAASPRVIVYETTGWTQLATPSGLDATAITDIAWVSNDVLAVLSTYIRILDYSGTPSLIATLNGGHSTTAIETKNGGVHRKFAGVVTDGSSGFLARTVRAIDRSTGRRLGETVSSAVDGTFTLIVFSPNPAIVYCVGDGAELTKLVDSVIPVAL